MLGPCRDRVGTVLGPYRDLAETGPDQPPAAAAETLPAAARTRPTAAADCHTANRQRRDARPSLMVAFGLLWIIKGIPGHSGPFQAVLWVDAGHLGTFASPGSIRSSHDRQMLLETHRHQEMLLAGPPHFPLPIGSTAAKSMCTSIKAARAPINDRLNVKLQQMKMAPWEKSRNEVE